MRPGSSLKGGRGGCEQILVTRTTRKSGQREIPDGEVPPPGHKKATLDHYLRKAKFGVNGCFVRYVDELAVR